MSSGPLNALDRDRYELTCNDICWSVSLVDSLHSIYLSPQYISSVFKMASTWRYTLVCLDGVMDISTAD